MNFLTDVLYEFQSTLLQEERHVGNGYMYWISKISIHAPTRGATHGPCECLQLYPYFNPRSYKRSDQNVKIFMPHHTDFNPRSYKRSDKGEMFIQKTENISIHAPTRGATIQNFSFLPAP